MAKGFESLRRKLGEYSKRVDDMSDLVEKVGIFEGQRYEDGTSVAYVATIQEFGAPTRKIPPRPFFRPTLQEQQAAWVKVLAHGAKQVVKGEISASDALALVGEVAVADIKQAISEVDEPALSPITVMLRGMKHHDENLRVTGKTVGEAARRVDDGETNYGASTKPLEDTFTMRDSVTHAQERK